MKILVCLLSVTVSVSAGLVNTVPGNVYIDNTYSAYNSALGPDRYTNYGHGTGGQFVQVLPEAGHSTLGGIAGVANYGSGVQQVSVLQGQTSLDPVQQVPLTYPVHQVPLTYPVHHAPLTYPVHQVPLTYTSAGNYGAVQLLQTDPHSAVHSPVHAGVQTVHLVQQPVIAAAPAPVLQTVRIIQGPAPIVPRTGAKTVKIIQTPSFENVQTIRLVKESVPAPINGVKTIRLLHDRLPLTSTKTIRVIQEPVHPKPPVPVHHHHPISPQPAPVQPPPVHQLPPHPHPPHPHQPHSHTPNSHLEPPEPLPDVADPEDPETQSGYRYNIPNRNLKS